MVVDVEVWIFEDRPNGLIQIKLPAPAKVSDWPAWVLQDGRWITFHSPHGNPDWWRC